MPTSGLQLRGRPGRPRRLDQAGVAAVAVGLPQQRRPWARTAPRRLLRRTRCSRAAACPSGAPQKPRARPCTATQAAPLQALAALPAPLQSREAGAMAAPPIRQHLPGTRRRGVGTAPVAPRSRASAAAASATTAAGRTATTRTALWAAALPQGSTSCIARAPRRATATTAATPRRRPSSQRWPMRSSARRSGQRRPLRAARVRTSPATRRRVAAVRLRATARARRLRPRP